MQWVAFPLLVLIAVVGAEESCDQYAAIITPLENSTCILRRTNELEDALYGYNGTTCRKTLKVTTNCTCKSGSSSANRAFCVHDFHRTKDDNSVNVTIGYCHRSMGQCSIANFSAHWEVDVSEPKIADGLKAYPRPQCVAANICVSPELTASAGCEYYCYQSRHRDIDDGRPCVVEWYAASITGEPVVTLTGSCSRGICRYAASSWKPITGLCHDSERFSKYGEVVQSCKYRCPNNTIVDRPYGVTCLIRKTRITNRKVVGICNHGSCVSVREEHPCAMRFHDRSEGPQPIARKCMCDGKPVASGTLCGLTYSFGFEGYFLQRVGACFNGECQEQAPARPPKQKFKKSKCKVEDIQVTPELIVAAGCKATCRFYETEDRPNGTLCFLQYRRDSFGYFQHRRTYDIGECEAGECRYSGNSFIIKH